MPQIIMAGSNVTELGWDAVCSLAVKAVREGKSQLAVALCTINAANAFGSDDDADQMFVEFHDNE